MRTAIVAIMPREGMALEQRDVSAVVALPCRQAGQSVLLWDAAARDWGGKVKAIADRCGVQLAQVDLPDGWPLGQTSGQRSE